MILLKDKTSRMYPFTNIKEIVYGVDKQVYMDYWKEQTQKNG
jgi:hypothetical protein